MPHSSGGGHSSHGSHRSSSSKPANVRYGNRYYRGAHRYVYYMNGTPQYYYSDRPYTVRASKGEKIKGIFRNIISTIFGIILAVSGIFSLPHKVKTDYNTDILIKDSAQVLSGNEEMEMTEVFSAFREKTGVTPAFFSITGEELRENGGNLEKYAYRLYVNTFDDEKHWLVVYCSGDNEDDWSWEGMIGDDCESIISTDLENELTERLHKNLKNDPKMVSAAVTDAFTAIGNKTGKTILSNLPWMLFMIGGGAFVIYNAIKKTIGLIKTNSAEDPRINSVQCPTDEAAPATEKCEYCGGEYVAGLHTTCPHCGAPIEPKAQPETPPDTEPESKPEAEPESVPEGWE